MRFSAVSRRWGSLLLVVSLLATGCSGRKDEASSASSAEKHLVEVLRALPFGGAALGVVNDVLTRSGVGVHEDEAGVKTGNPIRVTRWQARNLAIEAANAGGIPGDALDELAPVPDGAPPMAFLVAAWITTYDSPGARFSRELMAGEDWHHAGQAVFPNLVLALFLADATAGLKTPEGSQSPGHAMALVAATDFDPCTFATTFIQHAILDAASLLKVNAQGGGLFSFFGKIWNAAVDLAAAVVNGLITAFGKPVLDLMANIFGVVATFMQLSSFLVQWRADLRADPSHNRFGVDSEVITGQFQLVVQQDQPPIPEFVIKCAASVNVDLSSAGSAAGSKVVWTGRNAGRSDLSTRTTSGDALAQDKTAKYRYQTGQETSELAASPETESQALIVSAMIERNDVAKTRELLTKLAFNLLPSPARGIVHGLAQPLLDKADAALGKLTGIKARTRTFITFHVPGKTPTPPTKATPGAGIGTVPNLPAGCPSAVLAEFGYSSTGSQTVDGVLTCFYISSKATGQLGIGISHERKTVPACPDSEPVNIPGADAAWFDSAGCGGGTPGVRVSVSNGGMLISGGGLGRDQLIAVAKRILGVS